jgi:transcriptional regulator with XRE-family HTH domain
MPVDSRAVESSGLLTDSVNPQGVNEGSLGARLKALRLAYGLSQRELAKRSQITNSNISMIEQGAVSPSVQSLTRILSAFPISLADFFAWDMCVEQEQYVFSADTLRVNQKTSGGVCLQRLIGVNGAFLSNPQIDLRQMSVPVGYSSSFTVPANGVDFAGFVIAGQIELFVAGGHHKMTSGDAFYIPAHQRYRMSNLAVEVTQLIVCSLINYTPR